MVVRPDAPGAGHTGPRALSRPEGAPAPLAAAEADGAAAVAPAEAAAVSAPEPQTSSGGIPRWLVLLAGLATATVAVAGLRAVAWLVAPVFLALVIVVALSPVQGWLRRKGVPRWLAT